MSMEKWQACPVCCGTGYTTDTFLSCIKEKCAVCESEKIIHTETGLPPSRHRALVFGSGVEFAKEGPKVWTGTGVGGITGDITPTGETYSMCGNPVQDATEYDHRLYENINDRIPRMENPPPPPVKIKEPSNIL